MSMSRAPGVLDTMRRHWHPSPQDLQLLLGANPAAAVHKHPPTPSPDSQYRDLPPQQRYQYTYDPVYNLQPLEQESAPLPIIHGRETLGNRPTCAVMAASDKRYTETPHPSPSIGNVRTIRMKYLHEGSKLGIAVDSLQVTAVLSPMASSSGWRAGDHIVAVNGIMVFNQDQFKTALGVAIREHAATGAPLIFQVSKSDHVPRKEREDPCCGFSEPAEPRTAPMTVGQVVAAQSYHNTEAFYGSYAYPGLDEQYIHPNLRSQYTDSNAVRFDADTFYSQEGLSRRRKNACLC